MLILKDEHAIDVLKSGNTRHLWHDFHAIGVHATDVGHPDVNDEDVNDEDVNDEDVNDEDVGDEVDKDHDRMIANKFRMEPYIIYR